MSYTTKLVHNNHIILKEYEGCLYVFRYAYQTQERATEIMNKLVGNFGQPVGIDMDLAANYWRVSKAAIQRLKFITRTTQKNSSYVCKPE